MCGIFGIIFTREPSRFEYRKARFLFARLAIEAQSRGRDATGIAVVERDGTSYVAKVTQPAIKALQMPEFYGKLKMVGRNTAAIIGHTRLGTHGANTEFNAHPIWFDTRHGRLIGTHNGVLWNYVNISPYPQAPYDSDTANLVARLSKEHEDDWVSVLEQVSGSFALVLQRNDKIFMARNSGSPTIICEVPEIGAIVYASTEHILDQALDSLNMENNRSMSVPLNKLFTMSLDGQVLDVEPFEDSGPLSACSQHMWDWDGNHFIGE